MVAANKEEGALAALLAGGGGGSGKGLTGAEIAGAYKAALADFVSRRTSRAAAAEVSKLLAGALGARKQELAEADHSSSHRISNFY